MKKKVVYFFLGWMTPMHKDSDDIDAVPIPEDICVNGAELEADFYPVQAETKDYGEMVDIERPCLFVPCPICSNSEEEPPLLKFEAVEDSPLRKFDCAFRFCLTCRTMFFLFGLTAEESLMLSLDFEEIASITEVYKN